jgi:hypothetical protein
LFVGGLCFTIGALADAGIPFYVGGTQVHEKDHDGWVSALRHAGLNTVAVTVYARQGEWDSDQLGFDASEPSVLAEIRAAKAAGLQVVLILRVAVDHAHANNKFIWHGMIMPASEQAIRSWFENYTRFVVSWARIGQAEGVDVLGIGSEMNLLNSTLPITRWGNLKNYYSYYWHQRLSRSRSRSFADQIESRHLWVRGFDNYGTLDEYLDARFAQTVAWAHQAYLRGENHTLRKINERRRLINALWLRLIGEARSVYDGKLSYAANFDSYRNVGYWHELDLIGINAYFSLLPTVDDDLTPEQKYAGFERSWQRILRGVRDFKRSQGLDSKPVLFTEIGYTFRRHSTIEPWAHSGFSVVGWNGARRRLVVWDEQPVDYEERRLALEALRAVHEESGANLVGVLYWKLSTDQRHEEIEPFVVHIGPDSRDTAQQVLAGF